MDNDQNPRDPGPMFPTLNGQEDGDPAILPPGVVPESELSSPVRGETLSLTPGTPLVEGAPASPPATEAVVDAGAAQPKKGRSFQERINQLTRRYHESEEQNGALQTQIRELASLVSNLQNQIVSSRAPAPTPQADNLGGLLSGEEQGKPAAGAAPVDIAHVVTRAIGAYDQQRRLEDTATAQFRVAQEASFAEAVSEFPELGDNRTTPRRIFNDLFARSPLARLPDGPYQVALQVKGILADEARAAASRPTTDVAQRKVQASVTSPTTPAAIPDVNRLTIKKEYDKVLSEVKAGKNDYETYRRFRYLQAALNK